MSVQDMSSIESQLREVQNDAAERQKIIEVWAEAKPQLKRFIFAFQLNLYFPIKEAEISALCPSQLYTSLSWSQPVNPFQKYKRNYDAV